MYCLLDEQCHGTPLLTTALKIRHVLATRGGLFVMVSVNERKRLRGIVGIACSSLFGMLFLSVFDNRWGGLPVHNVGTKCLWERMYLV